MRVAAALGAALAAPAAAQVSASFSGSVSADLRYRAAEEREHDEDDGAVLLPDGFSRNENRVRAKIVAEAGTKARGVGELELVWLGFSEVDTLEGLSRRDEIDPYWLEAHAAYLDVADLLPALDLRAGRQIVQWGAADQFNPTNNVNPLDLYDPLLFGVPLANQSVRADWHPRDLFHLTLVWTPVFRPARLPPTAPLALRSTERIPIQDAQFRRELAGLAAGFSGGGAAAIDVVPNLPPADIENTQGAARLARRFGVFDLSLSYFVGRDDMPQPYLVDARDTSAVRAALMYPRVMAAGADVAASLPWLADVGVWAEGAVFFPQRVDMRMLLPELAGGGEVRVAPDGALCLGDLCPDGARRPLIVGDEPFPKWTVGADYSLTPQLYANVQWVHGFPDEFGAGDDVRVAAEAAEDEHLLPRLGDYVVAGLDHRSFSDTLLLRLFGIAGARAPQSVVLFPQVVWSVADGAEITVGAFVMLGGFDSKFGDPAAGGTNLFLRGKMYF